MRESEKKKIYFCFILLLIAFVGIEFYTVNFFYKKFIFRDNGAIVAKINNISIYENDIKLRLDQIDFSKVENKSELIKAILLEAYLDKYFILQYKKSPFNKNEMDILINDSRKKIIKEKTIERNVLSKITEDDVKKKYEENLEYVKQKEERKISHILVETEDQAERIRKNILRFNNFDYQAEKYSLDKVSAIKGGDLGYLLKTEIALPEFANIAFLLNKNEISKPVKTSKGWHLIQVNDIRQVETKSFDEIKDILKLQLENERVLEYLGKIVDGADIKILNNSVFKNLDKEE